MMAMPAEFIAHCTIYSIQDTCISLIIIGDIHDLGFQLVHVQRIKEALSVDMCSKYKVKCTCTCKYCRVHILYMYIHVCTLMYLWPGNKWVG